MSKQSPAGGGTEDQDESQDQENTENADLESEQEDGADENDGADGGGDGSEGDEADKGGGPDEGEENDSGQPDPTLERLDRLEKLLLKEKNGDEGGGENDVKSLLLPMPSEAQMATLKAKLTEDPSQAVPLVVNLVNRAITNLYGQIEGLRADGSLDTAIDSLAGDKSGRFRDAAKFRSEIRQRMSKFAAKDRTNKDLLEMAYYAAVGSKTGQLVRKKEQGTEVNRRIAERTRVASPGAGGGKGGKGGQALTPGQKEAYLAGKKAGLFKDEADYRKTLKQNPKFRVA